MQNSHPYIITFIVIYWIEKAEIRVVLQSFPSYVYE